jgi:quinol-cytochrome oxidoreductase complex cytochrome b subunit
VSEKRGLLSRLLWSWRPSTPRESSDAIVRNFLLHALPARILVRSVSWLATGWLGSAALAFFVILAGTGAVLLFLYVPSVERAYASVKDVEFVVPFGRWVRGTHRIAAHLMVVAVVLHLVRVFLTGAYKKEGAPGAARPLNWCVGLALLACTLGLSFTGYLLPWDQLAFWAVTVGTQVAGEAPLVGEEARALLLGGDTIGQPALVRFYALHAFVLPTLVTFLVAYHLWRIRKDGGLAVADRVVDGARARARAAPAPAGKTYTLLGGAPGGTVQSVSPAALLDAESVPSVPHAVRRAFVVLLACLALASLLGLALPAPLEGPADPARTPNPAKAPWYFLWLQELVAITTVRVGPVSLDGALVGGLLVPTLLLGLLAVWPWLDRSPREAAGVWFHPSRRRQNRVFLAVLLAVVVLTVVGTAFRGPYWGWTWPWSPAPTAPTVL